MTAYQPQLGRKTEKMYKMVNEIFYIARALNMLTISLLSESTHVNMYLHVFISPTVNTCFHPKTLDAENYFDV